MKTISKKIILDGKITCSEVRELFEDYHNQALSALTEAMVQKHFKECQECNKAYMEWVRNKLQEELEKRRNNASGGKN